MESSLPYLLLADAILAIHVAFVTFVILGLILVLAGGALRWQWVRNPWFRVAHLVAIGIVVLQSWLGIICPLTTWEMMLREKGGAATYSGGFMAHWLGELLYIDAPPWMFVVAYTAFGVLVVASWFMVRPRRFARL